MYRIALWQRSLVRTSLTVSVLLAMAATVLGGEVSFSRQVLPLLSDRCFHCHGPDASHREAELRLDVESAAKEDRGGYAAVTPGKLDESELWRRIASDDEAEQMPPPGSHRKPLTVEEREAIRQWILSGAKWGRHWAFEPPQRPTLPDAKKHPIDAFVHHRLKQKGLTPSKRAAAETSLRRVSFDLIGLPPSLDEVDAVLADPSPGAYEEYVDRLLKSPHYGERMAMWWLDAARYSDTDGYQQDASRTNWPWRDWVVGAFNKNLPFDQFTREQFAGDLLPDATPEQKLATCFHRNHMTNGEGGRHPEESRIDYVIDRVNTTGSVWLGLTLGCCQCHSHKFDPISQKEYYSLFAFFDSIDEDGRAGSGAKPFMKYKSPWAARAVKEAQAVVDARKLVEAAARKKAESEFEPWLAEQVERVQSGFQGWSRLEITALTTAQGSVLTKEDDGTIQSSGPSPFQDDYHVAGRTDLKRITGVRLEVLPHTTHTDGKLARGKSGEFILTNVKLMVRNKGESQVRELEIAGAVADVPGGGKAFKSYGNVRGTLDDDPRSGWTTRGHDATKPHTAVFALKQPLELNRDQELMFLMLHRATTGDANVGRFRLSVSDQPGSAVRSLSQMPLEELAAKKVKTTEKMEAKLRSRLLAQFLVDHSEYQSAKRELDKASRQLATVKRGAGDLKVMVLSERSSPRTTHVLQRGVWDKKGEKAPRGFPAAVFSNPPDKAKTRLDLANWLVHRDNPLTARVVVNQLWQLCFGAGLVRTPGDFGLQGELPTHPDLLDWLAVEFIESGWDVKHLLRLIVTSETYRQDSSVTAELLEKDPKNQLLARGSRHRLPSWMIRDAALKSSGLLNPALGGPPVMPYQPDGVWAEMFMGRFRYEPSQGPAQFRRSLYAFWRRSAAPTFLFDSAQRRVCEVRPRRTNTPLHALTLLNDVSLLESSRAVAKLAVQEHKSEDERITAIFRRILSRSPSEDELAILAAKLSTTRKHYAVNKQDALQLLDLGQLENRGGEQPETLAAYMIIASMIFNLDEAITHE